MTSCSISLVACYKESLLRSITVFLNFLKLNFSHDRCVLLLHIFMLVWWGLICNEISILAALLHLVPLLLSRQTPVACSWVLLTGPHVLQGHRMGSSLRLSQGQEDFCWCLTPFLGGNWDNMATKVSNSQFLRQLLQFLFPLCIWIWDYVRTARKHRFDILQINTHLLYS